MAILKYDVEVNTYRGAIVLDLISFFKSEHKTAEIDISAYDSPASARSSYASTLSRLEARGEIFGVSVLLSGEHLYLVRGDK